MIVCAQTIFLLHKAYILFGNQSKVIRMKTIYKVDLSTIVGLGDFPCPGCGSIISPNDIDEEGYTILEVRSENDCLNELLLQCNKCRGEISVVGFDALEEQIEEDPVKVKPPKGKTDKQILQLLKDGSSLTLNEIAEKLGKKPKVVFKALKKIFNKGKILNNPAKRSYMLAKSETEHIN